MFSPHHRLSSLAVIALVLGLAPDASAQLAPPMAPPVRRDSIREYRGAYQRSFEQSWFIPCDAALDDRMWWVTLTDQALAERDSLLEKITRDPTDGLAVRWRGTIGPRMPAGMMGRGTRYILVTEFIEVKPLSSDGACLPQTKAS